MDSLSIGELEQTIEFLEGQIENETDQEEAVHLQNQLDVLRQYVKDSSRKPGTRGTFRSKQKENPRSAVNKSIKAALKALNKHVPDINIFINRDTLKTGYKCIYRPYVSNPIKWILNPPA